ncbi:hypothetical protein PVAND_017519 [Polypedilum vanderplanki]|uniref:TM2 domain-containing protein n=1 Tax=Polypedilum vanderplanki TaxID=319348 RepID=A0A9J6BJA4_POLVA|nr:hypothetical protein PVAND_017519 [Polypedilum vanderplanki]
MRSIVIIDRRFVIFMFISLAANYVKYTETAIETPKDQNSKTNQQHNSQSDNIHHSITDDERNFDSAKCTAKNSTKCSELPYKCFKCIYDMNCIYGEMTQVYCEPRNQDSCINDNEGENGKSKYSFTKNIVCRYCFLTEHWEHDCKQQTNCNSASQIIKTNCTVKPNILCLGNRTFQKNVRCNWSRGSKYFTALVLSITLGGFGVDRFYLGHWQEGIGKLFSFGGLGVWVIVDAILISIGYLGTSDGSLLL